MIYTSKEFKKHSGPDTTFEHPLRIPDYIPKELKNDYWYMAKVVHTEKYLDYLEERCRNVGKSVWYCRKCTFMNKTCRTTCQICLNRRSGQDWEYLGLVESDTTYINGQTFEILKVSVNCVCNMIVDLLMGEQIIPIACVRPPGHHAEKDKGQGFCLINNTAIGAEMAIKVGAKRVFIFDWDLHHGNGLQSHFYDRSDVYYCSIHGQELYPHTGSSYERGIRQGQNYNLNILLPKGTTDELYYDTFIDKVLPEIKNYQPDLILIAAGFDGLATDPINYFQLTPQLYRRLLQQLKALSKVALILEGGYCISDIKLCLDLCIDELQPNFK